MKKTRDFKVEKGTKTIIPQISEEIKKLWVAKKTCNCADECCEQGCYCGKECECQGGFLRFC